MSVDEVTELATGEGRPERPKPTMIALLTLAVVSIIIGLVLVSQRDGGALAELRIRQDNVDVRSQSEDFRPGVEGEGLSVSDAVRTDATGQAQIDFFDDSLTRLDADAVVEIRGLREGVPGGVLLTLESGRVWNRIQPAEGEEDRFEVRGATGTVSALGTTNVSDCRQAPTCYYIGVDGDSEVKLDDTESSIIGPDDCVRADPGSLRECTDHEFAALVDDWFNENEALDGGDVTRQSFDPSPSPSESASASPSGTLGPRRRTPSPRPPTPTPTPTRRPRPTRTDDPTPTPTRSPTPSPEPTASPTPTDSPVPTPTGSQPAD